MRRIVRRFPRRRAEHKEALAQSMTANHNGMPRGGGDGHGMEAQIIREMGTERYIEYDCVDWALAQVRRLQDGPDILALLDMMYWRKPHYTLEEAALHIPVSEPTAKRWHATFINLVHDRYSSYLHID